MSEVVVIGAGIAGLVVAHDLARAGQRVRVLEASDRVGGLLRRGMLAGVAVDLGAESFATRTDAVAQLVADAGLDLELVAPRAAGAFLAVAGERAARRAPLPRRTVLGIPADPTAPDVVALIGAEAAARAAQESTLPPYDAAVPEPSLFALVEDRCGRVVAERLVDTLCRSVYSRPATEVRLSALQPALWRALLADGSLIRAAAALAQTTRAGAAVGGIAGGMWRLPSALADAAVRRGADICTGVAVDAIDETPDGLWLQTTQGPLRASRVVVAVGPAATEWLLGAADAAPAPRVQVVAAAIDHDGLDGAPVGSGVLVDPALPTAAKALTHVNAKWAWADASTPPGRHFVRLSARDADASPLTGRDDVARDVALLTGVAVSPDDVVDVVVHEWTDAVVARPVQALALDAARDRGIHVTGAAVAGTGLAAVIPHARTLAERLAEELSVTDSTLPTRSRA